VGKCKIELFLVTVAYISEFSANNSTNITKEYIYCEGSGNILKKLKILHETLFPAPTIIRAALFCSLKTQLL
jgi:hypothetical protein